MEFDRQTLLEIQRGKKNFLAMAVAYFLGVFNDNFFKQAGLLLAVAAGHSALQGTATWLFSLPFVLFSAHGGWVADRFSKKKVVISSKFLELFAMTIGAYGLLTLSWNWILAMIFLMGFQSTFFTPALNGSIPELYPSAYVTKANAILKLVTTTGILLGMAGAGVTLDQHWFASEIPFGRLLVAIIALPHALFGVLASFWVHSQPAAGCATQFPWQGPLDSLRDSYALRKDPLLLLAVSGDVFFYFVSLLAVLFINKLGIIQLGFSKSITSFLAVSLMVGICIGSLIASRITSSSRWTHVLAPASSGMGLCLIAAGIVTCYVSNNQMILLLITLTLAGVSGGIFLIPLTAFIQVRPDADKKGKIIATANFCSFSGMLLAGPLFSFLDKNFLPSTNMIGIGLFGLGGSFLFYRAVKKISSLEQIGDQRS